MGHCLQSNIHIMRIPEGARTIKGEEGRGLISGNNERKLTKSGDGNEHLDP